jgi:hypothetical protein
MDERMKLVRAAREMGAVKVEIDGIKVEFPPEHSFIPRTPLARDVPPNLEYLTNSGEIETKAPEKTLDAIRGGPDPDEFSRQTDMWANYEPPGA